MPNNLIIKGIIKNITKTQLKAINQLALIVKSKKHELSAYFYKYKKAYMSLVSLEMTYSNEMLYVQFKACVV